MRRLLIVIAVCEDMVDSARIHSEQPVTLEDDRAPHRR